MSLRNTLVTLVSAGYTDGWHDITAVSPVKVLSGANEGHTGIEVTGMVSASTKLSAAEFALGGTNITSTAAELNKLDGYTGSVTELNYLDTLHATGVTSTEFDYLDGVSSNLQTQLDAKHATIDSSNRLNANLIHDGTISNTEFGYLNGVDQNLQTQLAAASANLSPLAGSTSIETLGTISTGTWNGTAIGTQYGGTGQNFSSSSGLLKFASGTASIITLPSGDVVGTTATQTLTNKTITAATIATSLDMNGNELILDADADTSITADTDDTIHIKIGGSDRISLSAGLIDLQNAGEASAIKFYCESSNAHFAALRAPAHSDFSGNITLTLPSDTGTLVGTGDSGTVSNTMLAGSIANAKLSNSTVSYGGVSLALGASDATPAFDLQDATGYPTSSLVGTITNDQLAGSIANGKLANSAVTVTAGDGLKTGGSVSLGSSVTLDISVNDFAGDGLRDAGSENLAVDVSDFAGTGLEDDGSENLRLASQGTGIAGGAGSTLSVAAAQTSITSIYNSSLAIGYGSSDANINFGTDNQITFDIDGTGQVVLKNGMFHPVTDSDVDLGKSDKYFKTAFVDTLSAARVGIAGKTTINGVCYTWPSSDGSDGQVLHTDGSGTLSWADDDSGGGGGGGSGTVNTGVDGKLAYYDGAGTSVNDASGLFYDDGNDRLGIGTTSPQEHLHILGGATQRFEIENTTSGSSLIKLTNSDGSFAWGTNSGRFYAYDYTATAERFTIASDGKVGIGQNAPKTLLTVEGAITLKEQAAADSDTAAYGQLWVKTATPNELYFTTDAGDDIQLTSGTSAAGGGGSGDITSVVAGTLLDGGATSGDATLNVDLTEAGEAAIANGDYILFLDGGATGTHAKEAIHDVATLFAGTGMTATNSVINLDAAQTGITSLLATDIKIGEDDETKIDFETADTINFYAGNEKQLILTDGALTPGTNAIVDLGTDALEFKDAYFDGTVEADAITIGGTNIVTGGVVSSLAATVISGLTEVTSTDSDYLMVWDATDSALKKVDAGEFRGGGGGGGGSGSVTTVKANGSQVGGADIVTLDFSSDFTVTETPDTEINVSINNGPISYYDTKTIKAHHSTDDHYAKVGLLCHFEGTNNDTDTTDDSRYAHRFDFRGDAKISSTQAKFGNTSLFCGGTNTDRVDVTSVDTDYEGQAGAGLDLGPDDFTLEFWLYWVNKDGYQTIFDAGYSSGTTPAGAWMIQSANNNGRLTWRRTGGQQMIEGSDPATEQWIHYAFVRSGTSLKCYRDGIMTSSCTDNYEYTTLDDLTIGCRGSGATEDQYFFSGYMDELRITPGVVRYSGTDTSSANFTVPTEAFSGESYETTTVVTGITGTLSPTDETVVHGVSAGAKGFLSNVKPHTALTGNGVVTYDITGPMLNTIVLKANQTNSYLGTEDLSDYVGKTVTFRLSANGADRTLAWHSSWNFVGEKPASIARDKIGLLSITTFGPLCGANGVDTDVVCAYAVED